MPPSTNSAIGRVKVRRVSSNGEILLRPTYAAAPESPPPPCPLGVPIGCRREISMVVIFFPSKAPIVRRVPIEGLTLQAHSAAIVSRQGPFTHLLPILALIGRFTAQRSDPSQVWKFPLENLGRCVRAPQGETNVCGITRSGLRRCRSFLFFFFFFKACEPQLTFGIT